VCDVLLCKLLARANGFSIDPRKGAGVGSSSTSATVCFTLRIPLYSYTLADIATEVKKRYSIPTIIMISLLIKQRNISAFLRPFLHPR